MLSKNYKVPSAIKVRPSVESGLPKPSISIVGAQHVIEIFNYPRLKPFAATGRFTKAMHPLNFKTEEPAKARRPSFVT
jgi:hypothetical protein